MTQAKALNNSLSLVNIYNNLRVMLDKQISMDNIQPAEFNELLNIRGKIHNALMMSLEDITSVDKQIDVLDKLT